MASHIGTFDVPQLSRAKTGQSLHVGRNSAVYVYVQACSVAVYCYCKLLPCNSGLLSCYTLAVALYNTFGNKFSNREGYPALYNGD